MLKRFALAAAAVALAVPALAQNPRGEAKATVAGKTVAIDYGRPSLKGRDMLAQAQVGQPWRLGADSATTLKTETDLAFGDVKVPSGEYILTATKVDTDKWHLNVLAKDDRSRVADVPLSQSKADESVETFTIDLKGEGKKGMLKMTWGQTVLETDFAGQ